jgi:hypothetical protein
MRKCIARTFLIGSLLAQAAALAAPELRVTPEKQEFGRQTKNAGEYPFVFKLKNTGDQPVKIDSVRGGCACLAVTLPKREIAPGEEVELAAVFHAAGYEGHVEKAIFLASNDATSRTRVLPFHIFLPYSATGLRFNPNCYRIPVETRHMKGEGKGAGENTGDGKNVAPAMDANTVTAQPETRNSQRPVSLRAAPVVENCNAAGVINLLSVKLPDGWRCTTPFPVAVKAESCSPPFEFVRDAGPPLPPDAELLFVFKTDSPKQPELKAVLVPRKPSPLPPTLPPPVVQPSAIPSPAPAATTNPPPSPGGAPKASPPPSPPTTAKTADGK